MPLKKQNNISITNYFLTIGLLFMAIFFGYVFYKTSQNEENILSVTTIPIILGIIFENKRLSSSWKAILSKILGSFFFSLFAFAPYKHENDYIFENHLATWPYFFIVFFVLISIIFHNKRIIPQLTEGITLLQSISIIYWIIDIGFLNVENWLVYVVVGLGLIFSIISFIHAFSHIKLTKKARLFLSIWSAIIMIVFAVDHIYRVFKFNYFVDNKILNEGLIILQYFLLGVSLIYIFQNVIMLLEYLPSKTKVFNKAYWTNIKKVNNKHISRYSKNQIKILDALLALLFMGGIYLWNYKYQFMPRHTLIWLIFWIFPLVISLKDKIMRDKKISQ